MFRPTRHHHVVFTQGYRALEFFAQKNFLLTHPLSSSCLWLDEEDFRIVEMRTRAMNVPNPLRIDPYAHHPVLSRFSASAQNTATAKKKDKRGAMERLPCSPLVLHDDAAAAAAAVAVTDHRDAAATHDLQNSRQRRRPGRPRKGTTTAAAAASPMTGLCSSSQAAAAARDAYVVPICSLRLTKPIYLCNLDQMYLQNCAPNMGETPEPTAAFFGDGQSSAAHGDPTVFPPLPGSARWSGPALDACAPFSVSLGEKERAAGSNVAFSNSSTPVWTSETDVVSGVHALQKLLPNPARDTSAWGVHHQRQPMLSVSTGRQYALERQQELHLLARRHRYESVWWGTLRQWQRLGAVLRPGETEHVVPISFLSKVVHISLIDDAATVLQNCYISCKYRRLSYIVPGGSSHFPAKGVGGDDLISDGEGLPYDPLHAGSLAFAEPQTRAFRQSSFEELSRLTRQDMCTNKYEIPLYLSVRQVRIMGLRVRPGAVGILPRSHKSSEAIASLEAFRASSSLVLAPAEKCGSDRDDNTTSPAAAPICHGEAFQHWYHLSQVLFPESYLVPSAVLAAELATPGVALHGLTGERLPFPELLYEKLIDTHPEVAAALLPGRAKERVTVPPTGLTFHEDEARGRAVGMVLDDKIPITSGDAMATEATSHTPERPLAFPSPSPTLFSAATASEELRIAAFVSTHASPKQAQGRHLWYLAEDVLRSGGIVEVNSAPVEVRVAKTRVRVAPESAALPGAADAAAAFGPGNQIPQEMLPSGALFNVSCLTDPDEALRLLSSPFPCV